MSTENRNTDLFRGDKIMAGPKAGVFRGKEARDITLKFSYAASSVTTSRGIPLAGLIETTCRDLALIAVTQARELSSIELPQVLGEMKAELDRELEKKDNLLRVITPTDNNRDLKALQDYLLSLQLKGAYCRLLLKCGATFSDFNEVLLQARQEIDTWPADEERKSRARESVTGEVERIKVRRKAATDLIERLTNEAAQTRSKTLNSFENELKLPLVNSRLINAPLADKILRQAKLQGVALGNSNDLLSICSNQEESEIFKKRLATLFQLAPKIVFDKVGFREFFCFVYAITDRLEDEELNSARTSLITVLAPVINRRLGIDIQTIYNDLIQRETLKLTDSDLVSAYKERKAKETYARLTGTITAVMSILRISPEGRSRFLAENWERLRAVALANYELRLNANDEFLNPTEVVRSLTRAVFLGESLELQFIRSVRWCYPNREVEVIPIAGDWETTSAEGKLIVRKEWVEKRKFEIYREKVLQPLLYYGIPVSQLTVLSTGDYEMTGPGYRFSEDDSRCVAARNYASDLRKKILEWDVFTDSIPFQLLTIKEFIATWGQPKFEELLRKIKFGYDQAYLGRVDSFCGYTSQSLNWLAEREYDNRAPFISWWNWDRTRDLVRYKTTFELAVGYALANQGKNIIVTVSGNRGSGLSLSKAKEIDRGSPSISITSLKLINDGDISKEFAAKTEVI